MRLKNQSIAIVKYTLAKRGTHWIVGRYSIVRIDKGNKKKKDHEI
jgi:hypothetical protein